jgi:hypothetical protein
MTRKDYTLIAHALLNSVTDYNVRLRFVAEIVPRLWEDNPRFNADTFAHACGVDPNDIRSN